MLTVFSQPTSSLCSRHDTVNRGSNSAGTGKKTYPTQRLGLSHAPSPTTHYSVFYHSLFAQNVQFMTREMNEQSYQAAY